MLDNGDVHTTMNLFDLGVIVILGLSGLLSFFRGFIREVLSLVSWVGAGVITLYTFPRAAELIAPQVHSKEAAAGLAALGVFVIALVVISIFTGILLKYVKPGKEVGVLDNIIGLAFGIARGILLIAIAYYVMSLVFTKDNFPVWVKKSVSRPYVERASHWVARLAPDYLGAPEPKKNINTPGKPLREPTDASDSDDTPVHVQRPSGHSTDSGAFDKNFTMPEMPSMKELQKRMQIENEGK